MSKLPLKYTNLNEDKEETYLGCVERDVKLIRGLEIEKETKRENLLKQVYDKVLLGEWSEEINEIGEELRPFYYRRNELSIENGCLMWGFRVMIPKSLQIDLWVMIENCNLCR